MRGRWHERCRPRLLLPCSHAPRGHRRPSGRGAHTPVEARARTPHGRAPRPSARARRASSRDRRARSTRRSTSIVHWLERQLAKAVEPRLGLERLRPDRGAGTARGAGADLAARAVGGGRARRVATRGSRCATSGAAGARARARARSASTGGSCSRRTTCSTTSSCTRSATWSSTTTARRSGALVGSAAPRMRESKQWLDEHGWEILAYQPPVGVAA